MFVSQLAVPYPQVYILRLLSCISLLYTTLLCLYRDMVGMEDRAPVLWIAGVFVLCLTKCVFCQEIPQGVPTEGAPGTSPGSGPENSPQSGKDDM